MSPSASIRTSRSVFGLSRCGLNGGCPHFSPQVEVRATQYPFCVVPIQDCVNMADILRSLYMEMHIEPSILDRAAAYFASARINVFEGMKMLHTIYSEEIWKERDYKNFREYVEKDCDIKYAFAMRLVGNWNRYIIEGGIEPLQLAGVDADKLAMAARLPLSPAKQLEKAISMRRDELSLELKDPDGSEEDIGIVYILTNEAMAGYVKIGRTSTSLEQRIRELSSSTSIPLPFTAFYACTVKGAKFVEHQLHDAFDDIRVNPTREFFRVAPERVVAALKLAEIENITPKKDFVENAEDQKSLNEARKRRSRFNFGMVGIPLGAEIYFSRDENIKAKVIDTHANDSSIEVNGEKTNLSRSAQKILGFDYGVAGTDYWMYEGETLDERRRKMEDEEEN